MNIQDLLLKPVSSRTLTTHWPSQWRGEEWNGPVRDQEDDEVAMLERGPGVVFVPGHRGYRHHYSCGRVPWGLYWPRFNVTDIINKYSWEINQHCHIIFDAFIYKRHTQLNSGAIFCYYYIIKYILWFFCLLPEDVSWPTGRPVESVFHWHKGAVLLQSYLKYRSF